MAGGGWWLPLMHAERAGAAAAAISAAACAGNTVQPGATRARVLHAPWQQRRAAGLGGTSALSAAHTPPPPLSRQQGVAQRKLLSRLEHSRCGTCLARTCSGEKWYGDGADEMRSRGAAARQPASLVGQTVSPSMEPYSAPRRPNAVPGSIGSTGKDPGMKLAAEAPVNCSDGAPATMSSRKAQPADVRTNAAATISSANIVFRVKVVILRQQKALCGPHVREWHACLGALASSCLHLLHAGLSATQTI